MAVDWKPYICMQTNSTCYRKTTTMKVVGILWHDTGANNPNLCRYVQPTEGSKNYQEDIQKLGKNRNGNDWNHKEVQAGLNFWVGKYADGTVGSVQSMPWNFRPWGCGAGKNGSCNDGWIQFEICEDAKDDKEYAQKAYDEAIKATAWLCEEYGIDPLGTVKKGGKDVPTILCHWDSYLLGLGSGHDDIYDWIPKILGKTMVDVRNEVKALMSKKGWIEIDDKWYYYYNDGKFAVGWAKINNKWYYFEADGVMKTGWLKDSKWYYLNDQGKMVTGWQYIDDKWYYFANSGAMKTGWVKTKGDWYFLGKDGAMVTGWILDGKVNYYLKKENGDMAHEEWIKDTNPEGEEEGYYWLKKNGKFTYTYKGRWIKKGEKKWMFTDSSGWYAKNETIKINNIFYTFDADGFWYDDTEEE